MFQLCFNQTFAMILKINEFSTLGELQEKFSECFPGLRIEFYKGQQSQKTDQRSEPYMHLSDISKKHRIGELSIKSWEKAGKVIQHFKSDFGLLVGLFRETRDGFIPLDPEESLGTEISTPVKDKGLDYDGGDEEEVRLSI
jgi:hypothetical protein